MRPDPRWTAEHGLGWRNAVGFPEATSYTIMGPGARNGTGPPLELYHEHPAWFWPNNESTSVEGQLCWSEPSLVSFLTMRVRIALDVKVILTPLCIFHW